MPTRWQKRMQRYYTPEELDTFAGKVTPTPQRTERNEGFSMEEIKNAVKWCKKKRRLTIKSLFKRLKDDRENIPF